MSTPTYGLMVTAADLVELDHALTREIDRQQKRYPRLTQHARLRECSHAIVHLDNVRAQVNELLQEHGRSMVKQLTPEGS